MQQGLQNRTKGHLVMQQGLQNRTKGANVPQIRQDRQFDDHCTNFFIVIFLQQPLLRKILGKAADTFQYLFASVTDHFELCLAKCRTSSQVNVYPSLSAPPDVGPVHALLPSSPSPTSRLHVAIFIWFGDGSF